MDVRSIQSSPVFTGVQKNRQGRSATEETTGASSQDGRGRTESSAVLSKDETSFFEGLFPESRKDVRAYHAYSGKGEQQQGLPTGTRVDRKG
jgi:hypothetical protein